MSNIPINVRGTSSSQTKRGEKAFDSPFEERQYEESPSETQSKEELKPRTYSSNKSYDLRRRIPSTGFRSGTPKGLKVGKSWTNNNNVRTNIPIQRNPQRNRGSDEPLPTFRRGDTSIPRVGETIPYLADKDKIADNLFLTSADEVVNSEGQDENPMNLSPIDEKYENAFDDQDIVDDIKAEEDFVMQASFFSVLRQSIGSIFGWVKKNFIVALQLFFSFLFVLFLYVAINWIFFAKKAKQPVSNPIYNTKLADFEFVLLDRFASKFTNKEYFEKACTFVNTHVEGDVLEIGAGRGFLLPCLEASKIKSYNALDTNSYSFQDLQKRFEEYLEPKGVNKGEFLIQSASDMHEFANESFDTIFMIRTLCSIRDEEMLGVFAEIHRVLKKGGKFIYVEHVRDWRDTIRGKIQQYISPIWKVVFRGCQFKDGSMYGLILNKMGFRVTSFNEYVRMFKGGFFSVLEPQSYGIAEKI